MEAVRQSRIKRDGKMLTLILPDSFTAEEVDVIIWPSNEGISISGKNLSEELLLWPEMTDEEFALIEEKRKHFNAWK